MIRAGTVNLARDCWFLAIQTSLGGDVLVYFSWLGARCESELMLCDPLQSIWPVYVGEQEKCWGFAFC